MAELKYYDAGSGTWKSLSVSTPPEVYIGIDPPTPRDQQLLWVDPDESPPAVARDINIEPWHLVGAAGEPAFQNSWVNYGAPEESAGFRKYPDGRVTLKGGIKSGTPGSTSVAFTLPAGYRPPKPAYAVVEVNGPATGYVTIGTDGTVVIRTGSTTWTDLTGVDFDTESVSSVTSVVAQPLEPWHTVGSTGEPALLNSYVNTPGQTPVGFRKDPFGRVHIKGTVRTGTNNTSVFTLPVGYRPPASRYYTCLGDAGAAGNFVYVNTAGDVVATRSAVDIHFGDIELDTESVSAYSSGFLGGPSRVLALPVSPTDGQECYYVADAVNGIIWHLRYNAGSASAYKWEVIGGTPLFNEIVTSATENMTNTAVYSAVTTPGPSLTLPLAGDYDIETECQAYHSTTGLMAMSYDIGATGATHADAAASYSSVANLGAYTLRRSRRKTGLTAGVTLTAKYVTNTGTMYLLGTSGAIGAHRFMSAMPVRVG